MKRIIGGVCVLAVLCGWWAWFSRPLIPRTCSQVLVVVSDGWNATRGSLQCYDRAGISEPWRAVGDPVPVELGRGGLGWGRGLHPALAGAGPVKAEGDGRAPAGVFSLTRVFAVAPADVRGTGLPVEPVTPELLCVDDGNSARYNTMFSHAADQPQDWTSAENMLRTDDLYHFGVFVAHNVNPPVAGAGSCIFLHIRRGEGRPTAGCTAMEAGSLQHIIRWLRERPVLVQLPTAEYARLAPAWGLPTPAMP